MTNSLALQILDDIFSIYSGLLILIGSLGNVASCLICLDKSLHKVTTFRILSFVFFFDVATLYTWNLDIFLKIFLKKNRKFETIDDINIIENLSIVTCKIFTFIQYFSLQVVSWLLTFMSIDQILKLYLSPVVYNKIQTKVVQICFFIVLVLFILNSHILIFAGKISQVAVNDSNVTIFIRKINCYTSSFYSFYPTWDRIHLFIYSFIPFTFMIFCNILMIKKLFNFKDRNHLIFPKKVLVKRKMISITILSSSFLFILCTMPHNLSFGFFFNNFNLLNYGRLWLTFTDVVSFSFFSLSFLIHVAINKVFRNAICSKIKMLKEKFTINIFKVCCKSETLNRDANYSPVVMI